MWPKVLSNSQYNKIAYGPILIVAGGLIWGLLDFTTLPYYQFNWYIGGALIIIGIIIGVVVAKDFQIQLNELKDNQSKENLLIDPINNKLDQLEHDMKIIIQIENIRNELDAVREELRKNYG